MKKTLSRIYNFSGSWTGTIVIVLFVIFFFAQAFVIPSGSMKNSLLIGDFLFVKKFSYGIPTPHIPWIEVPVLPDLNKDGHFIKGKKPQRGDIVVFRYPLNKKMHFVKRNFAIGGDEVVLAKSTMYLRPHEGDDFIDKNYDKNDIVILNGKKFVKEPYKFKGIHYNKLYSDGYESAKERWDLITVINQLPKKIVEDMHLRYFSLKPTYINELKKDGKLNYNAFYIKVPESEYFMVGDNRNNSDDSRFWGTVPYKFIVGKPWFVYFSWDKDKKIRWERIGRSVNTLENKEEFIYDQP